MKNYIKKFGIDTSHFTSKLWNKGKTHLTDSRIKCNEKYTIDSIFIKHCYVSRKVMKRYILKYKLLDYKCQICGCDGNWLGYVISLELDHIDGDPTNNELTNLRFLCPNCHATTNTYRGKNKHPEI